MMSIHTAEHVAWDRAGAITASTKIQIAQRHEQDAVRERREHFGALVAVGPLGASRASCASQTATSARASATLSESIVHRVGEQREAPGDESRPTTSTTVRRQVASIQRDGECAPALRARAWS